MPTLDLGKVIGPQGPQGERGPQGAQGIQGTPGSPGPGVPAGGSTGQLLIKSGTADYAAEWESAGELALQPPKSYAGPGPIALATRSTDKIYVDFAGNTPVSGTPSPDNPVTLTGVPFSATAAGPDGQTRSASLGVTGYSLPDGTADSYDGKTGELVQRVGVLKLTGTENLVKHAGIPNCFGLEALLTEAAAPFSAISTHFSVSVNISNSDGFTITSGHRLYFRSAAFDGFTIDSMKSWFAAKAAAGTPVTFLYALAEPIASNRKADIPAFEGQTTVTGAAAAGAIDDRVLRLNGLMPFELQPSHPNLLDNWYFIDPINQRGQTEYTTGYTIDRWKLNSKTMTIVENGIKWEAGSVLFQIFEHDVSQGQSMTISYMDASGAVYAMIVPTVAYQQIGDFRFLYQNNILYISCMNSDAVMKAVKLELGTRQTLAHKIDGSWVLNDPPPNRALELAKCQRYLQILMYGGKNEVYYGYPGNPSNERVIRIPYPLKQSMRNVPTIITQYMQIDKIRVLGRSLNTYMVDWNKSPQSISVLSNQKDQIVLLYHIADTTLPENHIFEVDALSCPAGEVLLASAEV